ncbi:MAG: hypothetical protein JWN25_2951 [Verrucomicrobiales bacterium]|nr:hypothetical protein [Verrucomicrobiales bacterium]
MLRRVLSTEGILCLLVLVASSGLVAQELAPGNPGLEAWLDRSPFSGKTASRVSAPWGDLDINFLPLESSEVIFPDRSERLRKPSWFFPSKSLAQVTNFIESLNLTGPARKELLETANWQQVSNVWKINPTIDTIRQLDASSRDALYTVLAKHPANYNQRFPIRFTPTNFVERFAASKLTSAQLSEVRALCYTNLGYIAFCDFETLQSRFDGPAFDQLIKVLYSLPSVQVNLKISPKTDIDGLVKYWGKNQKEARIRPLLESVARNPLGGEIDILSLLPPFPRLHLYTFPEAGEETIEGKIDCFISGLNFFNAQPDVRFLDAEVRRQTIDNDYYAIETNPTFGDLFMLLNDKGVAVHMAVYIADNIVFTKNGLSARQPWCFMRIPDMMTYYPSTTPLKLVFLRHK